jgi:MFS family permease
MTKHTVILSAVKDLLLIFAAKDILALRIKIHYNQLLMKQYFTGLWRNKDFLKLWTSETISVFGSQITNLALPLTAALMLHATPFQMGALEAMATLPFALFSLFAGVYVDRMKRLPIIMSMECLSGVALLLVPLSMWLGILNMWVLYLAVFVCGFANVVFGVAHQTYVTSLVSRQHLVEANSKLGMSWSGAEIAGPSVAGMLVHAIGGPFAIIVDAITFFISAIVIRQIRKPEPALAAPAQGATVKRDIIEGLKLVYHNPVLWSLAVGVGLWQILHHTYLALFILFATRELHLDAGTVGLVFSMSGVGFLIGALMVKRASARYGIGPVVLVAMLMTGIAWCGVALAQGKGAIAAIELSIAMLLFGLGAGVFTINYISMRQVVTPDHMLGRMTATMRFLTVASVPIGTLLGGLLGELIGLRATLGVVGVLGVLLASATIVMSPLRNLKKLEAPLVGA